MGEFADGRGGRAKDAALSVICVSLEEELLAKSDVLARKLGYLARLADRRRSQSCTGS